MVDVSCPVCGGPGVPLGRLGQRVWWRCRACGIDFCRSSGVVPGRGGVEEHRVTVDFWVRAEDADAACAVLDAALGALVSSGGEIEAYRIGG